MCSTHMKCLKQKKLKKQKVERLTPRVGQREGELGLNEHRVSVLQDEKVLEMCCEQGNT